VVAGSDGPLAALVSLFMLGDSVPSAAFEGATGGHGVVLAPWLSGSDPVSSSVELAPYAVDDADWFVVADFSSAVRRAPLAVDHVLGVGGASTMLAQCVVRPQVDAALDLGTGCGVQALHLARHSRDVVATDTSARALSLAELTLALNGVSARLRRGSLFDPVAGQGFDLVVSNPPFVIGAPQASRHEYRDAGLPGDEVCARIVSEAHRHLRPGGWAQLLANWEIRDGQSWPSRPLDWLAGSPLDAWVVQREVQDPSSYVDLWLRDSGDDRTEGASAIREAWLAGLAARGVVGVGFGLVSLRAGASPDPVRRLQHHGAAVQQPLGPAVRDWFDRQDVLRAHPGADVLSLHLAVGDDVRVDTRRRPGGGVTERLVLQERALRFSGTLDPFGESLLDALTFGDQRGSRPVGEVVAALATADGLDVEATLSASVPVLRKLVEEGFLLP